MPWIILHNMYNIFVNSDFLFQELFFHIYILSCLMKHCAKHVLLNNNNALHTAISACILILVNLCLEMFLSVRIEKHILC